MKSISVYLDLIKYKLSVAVVFSSVTGYFIFSNELNNSLIWLSAGVFFLAAGAAVLNQYSERTTDLLMGRTRQRPIPSGIVSEKTALLSVFLLLSAGMICLLQTGVLPFSLGVINVILYNLVYTKLKRITVLSIIPGGLVGAVPPMIGYSSAGGSPADLDIIAFSLFMFLWQVPHFWLIIAKYGEEYKNAGLATISRYLTNFQIRKLVFTWALTSSLLILIFFSFTDVFGRLFLIPFSLINICFILLFYKYLFGSREPEELKKSMLIINSYGILIMILVIVSSMAHFN